MNCIFCHNKGCIESGERNWYCPSCKATFDPQDDGDAHHDPVRSAVRKEEWRLRQGKGGKRK